MDTKAKSKITFTSLMVIIAIGISICGIVSIYRNYLKPQEACICDDSQILGEMYDNIITKDNEMAP